VERELANLTNMISEKLEIFTDTIVELTKNLISIPTINPPGKNYERITSLLTSVLRDLGLDVYEYHVPRNKFPRYGLDDGSEDGINIVAIKSFGVGGKKVHIHTHYDVVPPGSGWSKDPFKPIIKNKKLYGRGASDMKSTIAASIYAIKIVEDLSKELGFNLRSEVIISIIPDEETGGHAGADYLSGKRNHSES